MSALLSISVATVCEALFCFVDVQPVLYEKRDMW